MLSLAFVNLLTKWPIRAQRRLAKVFSAGIQIEQIPPGPLTLRSDNRARRMSVLVALALALGVFLTVATDTMVEGENDIEGVGISDLVFVEMMLCMVIVAFGVAMASHANARSAAPAIISAFPPGLPRRAARRALTGNAVALAIIGSVVGMVVGVITALLFALMWEPSHGATFNEAVFTVRLVPIILGTVVLLVLFAAGFSHLGSSVKEERPSTAAQSQ
jgi:hypothetical protein